MIWGIGGIALNKQIAICPTIALLASIIWSCFMGLCRLYHSVIDSLDFSFRSVYLKGKPLRNGGDPVMMNEPEKARNEIPVVAEIPHSGSRCYTVQDIQEILGIGRSSVYKLLKRNEFRWVRIGTGYRISRKSFDEWLETQH